MIRSLALAVAMVVAVSSYAFAEDYRWSGIYAGVHGGWGAGDVDWIKNSGTWFGPVGTTHSVRGDGFLGGGQIGVLHQHENNLVTGIELSVSGLDASTSVASPVWPASDTWNTDVDLVATATARLGYSFGRFLPYVEAGYAGGNVRITNTDVILCPPPACIFESKKWYNGFVVGAGADYRVTRNIIAGLNYRYMDLGMRTHAGNVQNTNANEFYSASAEVHAATFRLSWLIAAPTGTAAAKPAALGGGHGWSGFYAGVHGGWGAGDVNWVDTRGGWFTSAAGITHSASGDSFLGGGQVGYLHHFANDLVTGVELSVSGLDASTSVPSAEYPADDTLQTDVDLVTTATARLGYAFGRLLPYVEAGYAGGNVGITNISTFFLCTPPNCLFETKRWHNGFVFGAGADFRVTRNIMAGVNYRFMNLSHQAHAGIVQGSGAMENYTVDAQVHSATFRLSWLFNSN
ncbi:MAG: outer membrane protein [Rhizobiaceae bacterium]